MQLATSFRNSGRRDHGSLPAHLDLSTILDPIDLKNKKKKKFDLIGVKKMVDTNLPPTKEQKLLELKSNMIEDFLKSKNRS